LNPYAVLYAHATVEPSDGAWDLLNRLAKVYMAPDATFPAPQGPGYLVRYAIDRIGGVDPRGASDFSLCARGGRATKYQYEHRFDRPRALRATAKRPPTGSLPTPSFLTREPWAPLSTAWDLRRAHRIYPRAIPEQYVRAPPPWAERSPPDYRVDQNRRGLT
jgi:hypothetical protein